MGEISEDVMRAAETALDNLLCNCREAFDSAAAMREESIKDIARAIMADRADRMPEASLRAALRPFAQAWRVATHHKAVAAKLTMAQLGELAAHEVSGVHFRNAETALTECEKGGDA